MSIFFHIDVNSAFLSWTSVHNLETGTGPDLRLVPSIIGGDEKTRHGIVLAKSIPAKKYKIETAEPIASALRKCPNLVIASPDHQMYHSYSKQLMQHLSDFCPVIEQVSVDECFMDYTPIMHQFASPIEAAHKIKDSVRDALGFTVNVGISDRKVLAKMASDFEKPDKVHTLFASEIKEKMWPLPVGNLFLCGKSSVLALHKLGIRTIGQLATTDPAILEAHMKSMGTTLHQYANGIDNSEIVISREKEKSIGNSTTTPENILSEEAALPYLLQLSDSVATRLRKAELKASVLCVEIKYSTFRSVSKQTTLQAPTDHSRDIYEIAVQLFRQLWDGDPIRLLGVRSTKLVESSAPVQLSLFDLSSEADNSKRRKLDSALDSIREKYGKNAITRGTLYTPDHHTLKDDTHNHRMRQNPPTP